MNITGITNRATENFKIALANGRIIDNLDK